MLKNLVPFFEENPYVVAIMVLFFFIMLRHDITPYVIQYIRKRFKLKDVTKTVIHEYMYDNVIHDVISIYIFKKDVIFTHYKDHFSMLTKEMEREKKLFRIVMLDFCRVSTINDYALDTLKKLLGTIIYQNDLRMIILFSDDIGKKYNILNLSQFLKNEVKAKNASLVRIIDNIDDYNKLKKGTGYDYIYEYYKKKDDC